MISGLFATPETQVVVVDLASVVLKMFRMMTQEIMKRSVTMKSHDYISSFLWAPLID